jgi:hypothetical protein
VEGEPVRISVCHCLACKRRTGSAFGYQARFPIAGFHSGSTVFYKLGSQPDIVAIPVGGFADPSFPPPMVSVYESRRHPWVRMPEGIANEGG